MLTRKATDGYEIGRQSDGFQGITTFESKPFNRRHKIRYYDPLQGCTTKESMVLDGSNGRMKDDLRGIFRDLFMIETPHLRRGIFDAEENISVLEDKSRKNQK